MSEVPKSGGGICQVGLRQVRGEANALKPPALASAPRLDGTRSIREIQILTVHELLEGQGINYPSKHGNVTLKRAQRAQTSQGATMELPLGGGEEEPE